MRERVPPAIIAVCFTVVLPTVVSMMWPTIDPATGWAVIVVSVAVGLLAFVEYASPGRLAAFTRGPWRRPAKPAPVSAREVIQRLAEGEDLEFIVAAAERLRQMAYKGEVVIRAREFRGELLRPIPADFWRDNGISAQSVLDPTRSVATESKTGKPTATRYIDLEICPR